MRDLPVTSKLKAQIKSSYYHAYRTDPNVAKDFGPPGQPSSAVILTDISHAGVIRGSMPSQDQYWVVAGVCIGNPVGCQDAGSFQVFRRTGTSGYYQDLFFAPCEIPRALSRRWYPGGHFPMGEKCPS